jgi:hypothetical protein
MARWRTKRQHRPWQCAARCWLIPVPLLVLGCVSPSLLKSLSLDRWL